MIVLKVFVYSSWMNWLNWRVLRLERGVSQLGRIGIVSKRVNEPMVLVELWTVQNSNPFGLVIIHLLTIIPLNWTIFLLFNPLILAIIVLTLPHSFWLVRLIDWIEFTDLPQLQSVKLGYAAFCCVQSVVFESDWLNGLMIQICQNYNLLILVRVLLVVTIERRLTMDATTTRTQWQCEVRLNEMSSE